ncbi:hypothetical protein ACI65C_011416 [Semiaphis heraclei]
MRDCRKPRLKQPYLNLLSHTMRFYRVHQVVWLDGGCLDGNVTTTTVKLIGLYRENTATYTTMAMNAKFTEYAESSVGNFTEGEPIENVPAIGDCSVGNPNEGEPAMGEPALEEIEVEEFEFEEPDQDESDDDGSDVDDYDIGESLMLRNFT